ncbi:MAG: PhzF family phenazine biosynthesis protein [Acetobacteraceae bacterium]|nr:PhzF family phenazine biosynthesis protein [Acetobacteraceae bacterium]
MPALEFDTADVFTDRRFGGNPLAVVYDADALDGAAMQRLAREFNLSETVFVLAPRRPGTDAFIRIFTPAVEMPFAGHPNVGCAVLLARRRGTGSARVVLDQQAGPVPALLARDAAGAVTGATIEAPKPHAAGAALDPAAMAACAGLPAGAIAAARLHSCGAPFAIAAVADAATLAAAAPVPEAFRAHLPVSQAIGLLLHTRHGPDRHRVRMFGPLAGVPEDPATGSAAVAFGGLLLAEAGGDAIAVTLEQGAEMGRPSLLSVAARRDGTGAIRVSVGGGVVAVSRGMVEAT